MASKNVVPGGDVTIYDPGISYGRKYPDVDPTLRPVGYLRTDDTPETITVGPNNVLYLGCSGWDPIVGPAGICAYDLSNPLVPSFVGKWLHPNNNARPSSPIIKGAVLFFASNVGAALYAIDISNPNAMVMLGNVGVANAIRWNVSINENVAVCCVDILRLFDITNPAAMAPLGTLAGVFDAVKVHGNRAYVVDNANFHVIDISNPALPAILATIPLTGVGGGKIVLNDAGTRAYVNFRRGANLTAGIYVINVNDPANPWVVGEWIEGDQSLLGEHQGPVRGNVLYGCDLWARRVFVLDISNDSSPNMVANGDVPGTLLDVFVNQVVTRGNYIYGACSAGAASQIDKGIGIYRKN